MSATTYSGIGEESIDFSPMRRVRLAADLGSSGHVFAYAIVRTESALTLYISESPHRSYPLWTSDSELELVGWRLLDWLPGRSEQRLLVDLSADVLTVQVSEDDCVTLKVRDIDTDEVMSEVTVGAQACHDLAIAMIACSAWIQEISKTESEL